MDTVKLVDSKIDAKLAVALEARLVDVKKELQTVTSQLEVDRQAAEYAGQMSGLSCGLDYPTMLTLYDRLVADPKYKKMSASVLGPIYSKILYICSRTSRPPRLTVAELNRIAEGLPIYGCQGDARYFLGICYLGQKQTTKARDFFLQVYEAPLPIEQPDSAIPTIMRRSNQPLFADSGIVAMLLICEVLDDRHLSATTAERVKAVNAALDLLVSPHRAVEIPVVLRRIEELRESPFIKHIQSGNASLLKQAYNDLCSELEKNKDMARVFDSKVVGSSRKYEKVEFLLAKGVRTSADYSQDCQEPRKDP